VSDSPEPPQRRLDPDLAAAAARGDDPVGESPPKPTPPTTVDVRRYRWMIGGFGLLLVIAVAILQFASHGIGTAGVPAGKRLHFFVAPLATSGLNLDANTTPRCDPAHPTQEGLNVCGDRPIVLVFFVTGASNCERQVDTLQAVSRQLPADGVQFAAVAVRTGRAKAAGLVRSHHWTIPIAYDRDGALGALYGVEICPLVELAYRGGTVAQRLIGNHWLSEGALAARVSQLEG
jgi:AhpC/TSA family